MTNKSDSNMSACIVRRPIFAEYKCFFSLLYFNICWPKQWFCISISMCYIFILGFS